MHARNTALALLVSLAGCAQAPEPAAGLSPHQVIWCYRTLADIDCLRWPDPAWEGQLVGIYFRPLPPGGFPLEPMPPR